MEDNKTKEEILDAAFSRNTIHYAGWKKYCEHEAKAVDEAMDEFSQQSTKHLQDALEKIEKLSRYDDNHDKMLYNVRQINEIVKPLLNTKS